MKAYLATASAVFFAFASQAVAAQNCGNHDQVVDALINDYGEAVMYYGLGNGALYLFWANEQAGTWTIIRTNGEIACMMAAGDGGAGLGLAIAPDPDL